MFTGLVETTGAVAAVEPLQTGLRLAVDVPLFAAETALGDSVAVQGACLTVVKIDGERLYFDVSPETLQRTTLGSFKRGTVVNLERALRLSDRLGGHLVTGHIDGIGTLRARKPAGGFTEYSFSAGSEILAYAVPKGSIAVDGISLTIADLSATGFSVAIIPHTAGATTLGALRTGAAVNLEADLIGKYVARIMAGRGSAAAPGDSLMRRLTEEGYVR